VPVSVVEPEVPVTVITYSPAVVPAVSTVEQAVPPPPLPQAATPLTNAIKSVSIPIDVRQLRLLAGIPISIMQASAAPPAYQGLLRSGMAPPVHPGEDAAVVEIVSVAVPAIVPLIATGLVVPKLSVGGTTAFAGLEVMAAVSPTLPVNPLAGVSVMAEVLPEVAPAATETAVPAIVNVGGGKLIV